MAWRPHGRASVDRKAPRAWAICDSCSMLYNHRDLRFQYDWAGNRLVNQNFLVCEQCYDTPQEQLRTIILPADPEPIRDPRPERADTYDPVSVLAISNNQLNNDLVIGSMTQGGGLKAAFDSNVNKPFFLCAATFVSVTGILGNWIGRNWNGITQNNAGINASGFTATAPNDAKFFGGGSCAYAFQGSNDRVFWISIYSGFTAGTVGEVISIQNIASTNYLNHRIAFTGDGINSIAIAQLAITSVGNVGTSEV